MEMQQIHYSCFPYHISQILGEAGQEPMSVQTKGTCRCSFSTRTICRSPMLPSTRSVLETLQDWTDYLVARSRTSSSSGISWFVVFSRVSGAGLAASKRCIWMSDSH